MEETLHIAIEKSMECLEHAVKAEEHATVLEGRVSFLEESNSEIKAMVNSLLCCNAEHHGFLQGLWRSARTVFALISLVGAVLHLVRILLQ